MKILSATSLVLLSLILAACGGSSSSDSEPATSPDTTQEQPATEDQNADSGSAADGKEIFTANCASCHTLAAADATGTVGPDLDTAKWDEAKVQQRVEDGAGAMPSFSGTLSADEITAVAKFVSENDGS